MNQPQPPQMTPASIFVRLIAFGCDVLSLSVLLVIPILAIEGLDYQPPSFSDQMAGKTPGWMLALALVGLVVYFAVFEGLWGTTPGKRLLRLKVVKAADGSACGWVAAWQRDLLRIVDLLFYAIPGIIALIATRGRCRIGDLVAGTMVVSSTPAATVVAGDLMMTSADAAIAPPPPPPTGESALAPEYEPPPELEQGWYHAISGTTTGPFSWEELWDMAAAGELRGSDPVWHEDYGEDWIRAGSVPELKYALAPRRPAP